MKASSGILEIILRGKDGDITYDFEPIPSIIASRGKPLITLKSPGLLAARENIVLYVSTVLIEISMNCTVSYLNKLLKLYFVTLNIILTKIERYIDPQYILMIIP